MGLNFKMGNKSEFGGRKQQGLLSVARHAFSINSKELRSLYPFSDIIVYPFSTNYI